MERSRAGSPSRDPRRFLPLTSLSFFVLLVLAEAPGHGYALVRRIRERSDGLVDPGTGSFYTIIQGLAESGLIREDPGSSSHDGRRRQYAITALGREVLSAEARRLTGVVAATERALLRLARKRSS